MTESIDELRKLFKPPSVSVLVNVEKKSKYPFIIFGKLPSDFDTKSFIPTAMSNVLSPDLRINDGIYDVMASIIRPITPLAVRSTNVQLKDYNSTSQYSQLDCLFSGNEHGDGQYCSSNVNNILGQPTSLQGSLQDRTCPPLGYVILAFQTFPGEDSSKLEENWITWTGEFVLFFLSFHFIFLSLSSNSVDSRTFYSVMLLCCYNGKVKYVPQNKRDQL